MSVFLSSYPIIPDMVAVISRHTCRTPNTVSRSYQCLHQSRSVVDDGHKPGDVNPREGTRLS